MYYPLSTILNKLTSAYEPSHRASAVWPMMEFATEPSNIKLHVSVSSFTTRWSLNLIKNTRTYKKNVQEILKCKRGSYNLLGSNISDISITNFTAEHWFVKFCHVFIINLWELNDTFTVTVTTNVKPCPISVYCFNSANDLTNLHLHIYFLNR